MTNEDRFESLFLGEEKKQAAALMNIFVKN